MFNVGRVVTGKEQTAELDQSDSIWLILHLFGSWLFPNVANVSNLQAWRCVPQVSSHMRSKQEREARRKVILWPCVYMCVHLGHRPQSSARFPAFDVPPPASSLPSCPHALANLDLFLPSLIDDLIFGAASRVPAFCDLTLAPPNLTPWSFLHLFTLLPTPRFPLCPPMTPLCLRAVTADCLSVAVLGLQFSPRLESSLLPAYWPSSVALFSRSPLTALFMHSSRLLLVI